MDRNELRKLMDCYGSQPPEAADPQFAALSKAAADDESVRGQWQAVQAWDDTIRRALHDVPVPADLQTRLLTAMDLDDEGQQAAAAGELTGVEGDGRRRTGRRAWLRVALAVLSTAAVLAVIYLVAGREVMSVARIDEAARRWRFELNPEGWKETVAPRDHSLPEKQLRFTPTCWQSFAAEALGDSHAVAYRGVVPRTGKDAILLVIRTRAGSDLPPFPPPAPNSTTADLCVGIWKSGDCVYVLMVPGAQSTYRRLLNLQSIAWLSAETLRAVRGVSIEWPDYPLRSA